MIEFCGTTVTEDDVDFIVTGVIRSGINRVAGGSSDDDIGAVSGEDQIASANFRIGCGGGEDAAVNFPGNVAVVTKDNIPFNFIG